MGEEKKRKIFIPNEIFDDLYNCDKIDIPSHIAFAYSYYFYLTYLYRYSEYGSGIEYTQERIKADLGFHPKYKKIDYIIKKNGLLETMGYIESSNDYPVRTIIHEQTIEFIMSSEVNTNNRRVKIKLPKKAIYRTHDSVTEQILDGTFYDQRNTHWISYRIFEEMMANPQLGVEGFYLYGFLKYKNETHEHLDTYDKNEGYGISIARLSEMTRLKERVLYDLLDELGAGFIRITKAKIGEKKANRYLVVKN